MNLAPKVLLKNSVTIKLFVITSTINQLPTMLPVQKFNPMENQENINSITPEPIQPQPHRPTTLYIIIGVLILAVGALSASLFALSKSQPVAISTTPIPTEITPTASIPTSTPTPTPTTWRITNPQATFTPSTPSRWKRLTNPTEKFSLAYDPTMWTDMAGCYKLSCQLSTKTPEYLGYMVFSEPLTTDPAQQIQARYGNSNLTNILVDGHLGIMAIYKMPMESGGNQLIAGIVVNNNLITFKASIRDQGTYTLDYAQKVLGTLSF